MQQGIQCAVLPRKKKEQLYEKFKESHPKTSIARFSNHIDYAMTFMGLNIEGSDDEILNAVEAAIKKIDKDKEYTDAIMPNAVQDGPIQSLDDVFFNTVQNNGTYEIHVKKISEEQVSDALEILLQNYQIEDSKTANNARNNLNSSQRLNVFLRFLAKELLYSKLTENDAQTQFEKALKYSEYLFKHNEVFKRDDTVQKPEKLEPDYYGVVHHFVNPTGKEKSGFITSVTGKGYNATDAIRETNEVNIGNADATVVVSVNATNDSQKYSLKNLARKHKTANISTEDPIEGAEYITKYLSKKKEGAKKVFIKGSTSLNNWTQAEWNEYMFQMLQEVLNSGEEIDEIISDGMDGVGVAAVIAATALGIDTSLVVPAYENEKGNICFLTGNEVKVGVLDSKYSPHKTEYLNRFSATAVEQFKQRKSLQSNSSNTKQSITGTSNSKVENSGVSFYEGDITPDNNTIFVFGSNPEGRHGAGAAKVAHDNFGAKYGVGEGLTGNAYALPTKDLRVKENNGLRSIPKEDIIESIKKLYDTARKNPNKQFKVAYRNTDKVSLNGYTGLEMIDMFKKAGEIPSNILFSKEWVDTGKFNSSNKTNLPINDHVKSITDGRVPNTSVTKIISGGQTGGDRLGLEVGAALGIETGGTAAPSFMTENGSDESVKEFGVQEISKEEQQGKKGKGFYLPRTEKNVVDSDGTVYFSSTGEKSSGYKATSKFAEEHGKPFILNPTAEELREFIKDNGIKVLNVAGNRESIMEDQKEEFEQTLVDALSTDQTSQGTNNTKPANAAVQASFNKLQEVFRKKQQGTPEAAVDENSSDIKGDTISNENVRVTAKSKASIQINEDTPRAKLYRIINPQTVFLREKMIARDFITMIDIMIGERIDELQNRINDNSEEAIASRYDDQEELKLLQDTATSRSFFVSRNIAAIIERVKQDYLNRANSEYSTEYQKAQYQIVVDNFDLLFSEAKTIIESHENLTMENTEDDEGDAAEANEGAKGNDGWVVKARTTDPHTTISRATRMALEDIPIINPETGEEEEDDLGNIVFHDEDNLHAILIKELASMVSPEDFATRESVDDDFAFPALEKLAQKYSWVGEIIDRLNEDERLVATFYTDFRKDLINYWKVEDGKSIPLNTDSGTESQFALLDANYSMGNVLSSTSLYTTNSTISKAHLNELSEIVKSLKKQLSGLYTDSLSEEEINSNILTPFIKIFRSLGFTITTADINYILQQDVNDAATILSEVESILDKLKITDTSNKDYISENDVYTDVLKTPLRNIAKLLGTVDAEYVITSLRQGDETRYSYSAPNYIDTMFKNLTNKDPKARKDYIEEKWGKYGWFRDQESEDEILESYEGESFTKKTGWKVKWIENLYNDAVNAIEDGDNGTLYKELKMKDIPYIEVEGDTLKYNDWTPSVISKAYFTEYWAYPNSKFANFNFPIFADSPCAKFIRMSRITGTDYKEQILNEMLRVARQELWRMKFCEDRLHQGAEGIQNFDSYVKDGEVKEGRGSQFCFFPFLNTMTISDIVQNIFPDASEGELLERVELYLTHAGLDNVDANTTIKEAIVNNSTADKVEKVDAFIKDAISSHLDVEFQEFFDTNYMSLEAGVEELSELGTLSQLGFSAEDIKTNKEGITRALVEEYYWNQQLATAQIIEMTTTDLAFYKNSNDFQKRYKEVYAAGNKLFTGSRYGKTHEKTLYLKDFSLGSRSWINLRTALIEAQKKGELHDFEVLDILNKYIENNQVDAQAYRSISSYRSVLDMMGLWTDEMATALEHIQNGNYTNSDLNVIFGTIKPFLYTVSETANGTDNASYGTLMVPHQNKNSEFVILATVQTIGGLISKSSKLSALDRFMEDMEVDVVQFESAVKAGGQGSVDVGLSQRALKKEAEALNSNIDNNHVKEYLEKNKKETFTKKDVINYYNYCIINSLINQEEYNSAMDRLEPSEDEVYEKLIEDNVTNSQRDDSGKLLYDDTGKAFIDGEPQFNLDRIHTHSYDDYMIAQPTPQHFMDTDAVFGSQFRNLIISDIPDGTTFKVNGKEYTKEELLDTYRKLITENLLDGFVKARAKFKDIYTLQKFLKEQIVGNPRFSPDMADAFEIVQTPKGPVFNIPLTNPTTTIKMQEMINSIFKKEVTKQRIKGGSAILVSSFGFSKQLKVNRREDGSIKEIECYMPAYSKQFYEPFMNDDGTLDFKKMEREAPDLLKVIGYRIPTENKYSMCNLRIKGFLPQQNGGAIMLPAEITTMSGADFDVDKMFLMFPEFYVSKYDKTAGLKAYQEEKKFTTEDLNRITVNVTNDEDGKKVERTRTLADIWSDNVIFEDENASLFPEFDEWWEKNKENFKRDIPKVGKITYNHDIKDANSIANMSRKQRDNMLIDISYAILSHPAMANNVTNPGSFEKIKRISRATEIAYSKKYREAYMDKFKVSREKLAEHLMAQDFKTLDKFLSKFGTDRNPLSIDTFMYNHYQNTTGGTLIGIYANGTTGQAKFQESGLRVREDFAFTIDGNPLRSLDSQRTPEINGVRELISKNSSEWSAASVDNVKDPVLAKLFQNKNTANIAIALTRMGCSIDQIGLIFSHPLMQYLIGHGGKIDRKIINNFLFNPQNGLRVLLEDLASKHILKFNTERHNSPINTLDIMRDLTYIESPIKSKNDIEDVMRNNPTQGQKWIDFLIVMRDKIIPIAEALGELTRNSRQDSPNGAIDRTLSRAFNQRIGVDNMLAKIEKEDYPIETPGVLGQSGLLGNGTDGTTSIWAEKDELRKVFEGRDSLVSSFYTLGIDAAIDIISDYFPNYNKNFLNIIKQYVREGKQVRGTFKEETMDDLFFEMTTFLLSGTQMFGDDDVNTFEEKRNYYLYEFPKELIEIKKSDQYEEINKLNFMKKLKVVKGKIVLSNGNKLTPSTRMAIVQSFDSLLYMEGKEAEQARQLAIDLMAYAYYTSGFRFGPNNIGQFFSNTFISAFPEIIETLRTYNMDKDKLSKFLEQFTMNHPWQTSTILESNGNGKLQEGFEFEDSTKRRIFAHGDVAINMNLPNKEDSYDVCYRYIADGELYEYKEPVIDGGMTIHVYERSSILDKIGKNVDMGTVKYNINMSREEMAAIKVDRDAYKNAEKLFSSSKKSKGKYKKAKVKNSVDSSESSATNTRQAAHQAANSTSDADELRTALKAREKMNDETTHYGKKEKDAINKAREIARKQRKESSSDEETSIIAQARQKAKEQRSQKYNKDNNKNNSTKFC